MVVGRLLCFSQEVGAKVHQQSNLVDGLKQMTGRENQHSPEHQEELSESSLPSRFVCRIEKLKSFSIIY